MNRRPQKSRSSYDSFSPRRTTRFKAASPDTDFFEKRIRHAPSLTALRLLLLLFILCIVCSSVANLFVYTRQLSVPVTGLTEDFAGYTILHISDLKGESFGADQSRLIMSLADQPFDAVLITGDMVSPFGNAQPLYALIDALRALRPGAPIYFIAGDSDPEPVSMENASSGSPFAPWVLGAQQRGATLLSAPACITRGEQTLWFSTIAQLNLDMDTMQPQYEDNYLRALESRDENEIELAAYHLNCLEDTRSARKQMKQSDVYLALTHVPPMPEELQGSISNQLDLVLCGHYLGGLMRLPLIGPLFVPSQASPLYGLFPGADAYCGLSHIGHTQLYISPGLGGHDALYPAFFFRLFNPPTVTFLTLTPSSL